MKHQIETQTIQLEIKDAQKQSRMTNKNPEEANILTSIFECGKRLYVGQDWLGSKYPTEEEATDYEYKRKEDAYEI